MIFRTDNYHYFPLLVLLTLVLLYNFSDKGKEVSTVETGLDRVVASNFNMFNGKRVGIICNHTSVDKDGKHIVDLFHNSGLVEVVAIFSPEHGLRGQYTAGEEFSDDIDSLSGAKIYSLYGVIKKPTKDMLKDLDALIYDIQDVGSRFYTYISTMTYSMESAAENNIPFFVLDRPNPIRGDRIEGPILKSEFSSFVGLHAIPIRYGLTAGELARLINEEGYKGDRIGADLIVIPMKGWKRDLWYDETDLKWIPPSPNIKSLDIAIAYPGFCLLEGTNLSEGRGTNQPFLTFGSPWIDGKVLSNRLNLLNLEGVDFQPCVFIPVDIANVSVNPKYRNQRCEGARVVLTNREQFKPVETAVEVLKVINEIYPEQFKWNEDWIDKLYGSDELRESIGRDEPIKTLFKRWEEDIEEFKTLVEKYKIY